MTMVHAFALARAERNGHIDWVEITARMPGTRRLPTRLATPTGVIALYLVVTAPLVLLAATRGGDATGWLVLLGHAGALAGAWWWLAHGGDGDSLWAALAALLAVPALYAELPWFNQALAVGYHDALVLAWDKALTGFDPSRELAARFPHRWISEPLHFAYATFYPSVYVPPLLLALRRRHRELASTVLGLLVAATACYVVFAVFPVQGPRYFGPPAGVPDGPVRRAVLVILEQGSSRGAAFPSAHMAIMTVQSLMALRFQRRVGCVLAILTVGVGLGAVYGGFHYSVDMLVGAAVGGVAAWVALALWAEPSHARAAAP